MKPIRWKAHLNIQTTIGRGHVVKVDDAVACPVAIVMAGTGSKGPKQQEDHARLIAAAPELTERLTWALAKLRECGQKVEFTLGMCRSLSDCEGFVSKLLNGDE